MTLKINILLNGSAPINVQCLNLNAHGFPQYDAKNTSSERKNIDTLDWIKMKRFWLQRSY